MNLHRSAMLRCESLWLLPAGLLYHIIVHQINQLSPHVLIQSMRTSFCVCRLINRQNTGYNYQIWAMRAGNRSTGVMLSNGSSRSPPLFSLLIPIFRGRNQRFIMECTLLCTIAGYHPQCKVPAKVSQNSVKCPLKVDTVKVQIPIRGQRKVQTPNRGLKCTPKARASLQKKRSAARRYKQDKIIIVLYCAFFFSFKAILYCFFAVDLL